MKRDSVQLVSYSSSEDSDSEKSPPTKKRKLPTLAATLAGKTHVDNPALHQGRKRSTPHIDGQYATHVYASVPLSRSSQLFDAISKITASAKARVPALNDFFSAPDGRRPELHISVTRPIFVRAHQREELKRAVKRIADGTRPFSASLACITELVNDERTRVFLALEIGAGHHELSELTASLNPVLQAIRQEVYYSEPRFHASIGWALLDENPQSPQAASEYPTIRGFPSTLLADLDTEHRLSLSAAAVKSFDIDEICVKIGQDVCRFRLQS
ncbi:unnamed protein product [Mycena citricolor]|uniref:U6 snRNA phosphodiesterase 1 n=1 Tax=Mycena citricolor TaxID=2018698 RepID=A0AAD2HY42_9AGAR|nr:unnamed protein product [Mycena citricolor]CAK5284369.1 unnamed protein product [Mycena citricolor]